MRVESPVSGPAYGRGFRVIATVVVVALLAHGARVVLVLRPDLPGSDGWMLLGAATFALVGSWYFMVSARTTVDAQGIRQSGLIERRTGWDEIRTARVGGFALSRRLVVRTAAGRFRYYFGGTAELVAVFGQIASAYPPRR